MKEKINNLINNIEIIKDNINSKFCNFIENLNFLSIGLRKFLMIVLTILNIIMLFCMFAPNLMNLLPNTPSWNATQEIACRLILVNIIVGTLVGLYKIFPNLIGSLFNLTTSCFAAAISVCFFVFDIGAIFDCIIYAIKFIFFAMLVLLLPAVVVWYYELIE